MRHRGGVHLYNRYLDPLVLPSSHHPSQPSDFFRFCPAFAAGDGTTCGDGGTDGTAGCTPFVCGSRFADFGVAGTAGDPTPLSFAEVIGWPFTTGGVTVDVGFALGAVDIKRRTERRRKETERRGRTLV